MANKRMINGNVWEDEFFLSLSIFNRLLWIGILTACADDQGRLADNAALIRSKVFPVDDIGLADIEKGIQLFAEDNKIVRYTKNKKKCVQIINWWKHQSPRWASESTLPEPDGWTDRYRYHVSGGGQGGTIKIENWDKPGGFCENYIVSNTKPKVKDDINVNDEVNDEDEGEASPQLSQAAIALWQEYQARTGDTRLESTYAEELEIMAKKGIIPEDLRGAVNYFKNRDIYIRSPEHLERSAIVQRDIRLKNKRSIEAGSPTQPTYTETLTDEELERMAAIAIGDQNEHN